MTVISWPVVTTFVQVTRLLVVVGIATFCHVCAAPVPGVSIEQTAAAIRMAFFVWEGMGCSFAGMRKTAALNIPMSTLDTSQKMGQPHRNTPSLYPR